MAASANPSEYGYTKETGDLTEMNAGKDDANNLDAHQVGELAYAEIGDNADGSFAAYDIVALGGIPEPHRRNNVGKAEGDLQGDQDDDGTIEDVPDGTQVRIRITDYSHTDTIDESDWFDVNDLEQSDPAKRPTMKFDGLAEAEFASRGRHVVVEVRNKRQTFSASYADSNLSFPYVAGRRSV